MRIFAGVDGGATRTRAALLDQAGRVLGVGVAGPSNYGVVSLSTVQDSLRCALQAAIDQSGVAAVSIERLFLGMANVVNQNDRDTIGHVVDELKLVESRDVVIDHDIRIALAGGLGGREGIALIAGTGSSCYGRRADGQSWQAGGWSHLIDDVGSGYDLAVRGMEAAVRAADGRGPQTVLTKILFKALEIDELPDIVRRLHYEGFSGPGHPMSKTGIASLAPLVIDAADAGDTVAQAILERAIDQLTLMVKTVASKLNFQPNGPEVTLTGNVANCPAIKKRLCESIGRRIPGACFTEAMFPPVIGAALLAMKLAHITTDDTMLKRLHESVPNDL